MIRVDEVVRQEAVSVLLIRVQENSIMLWFANAVLMRVCRADENRSHRQGGCNFVVLSWIIGVQE